MTDEQLNCLIDIRLDLANDLFFCEDSIKVFDIANNTTLNKKQSSIIHKESYEINANKIRKKMEILDSIIKEEKKKKENI